MQNLRCAICVVGNVCFSIYCPPMLVNVMIKSYRKKLVSSLVIARYGRGGKRWIRYDTAQNIAIRYHTIWYTVPKRSAVCNGQQSKINAAFSLTPSHTFTCVQTPSTVDGNRTLSITSDSVRTWQTVRYQKLIDFSSIQTHAVHRVRPRSTTVLHWRTPSTTFESRERGDGIIALLDFSSVLTDVWTSLTTTSL